MRIFAFVGNWGRGRRIGAGSRCYQRAAGCLYSVDRTSSRCRWSGRMDYEQDHADCRRCGLDALAQWLHGHLKRRTQVGESRARRTCSPRPSGRGHPCPESAAPAASRSRPSARMALITASFPLPDVSTSLRLKSQSTCSIRLARDTTCGYTVPCREGGWHREAVGRLPDSTCRCHPRSASLAHSGLEFISDFELKNSDFPVSPQRGL